VVPLLIKMQTKARGDASHGTAETFTSGEARSIPSQVRSRIPQMESILQEFKRNLMGRSKSVRPPPGDKSEAGNLPRSNDYCQKGY